MKLDTLNRQWCVYLCVYTLCACLIYDMTGRGKESALVKLCVILKVIFLFSRVDPSLSLLFDCLFDPCILEKFIQFMFKMRYIIQLRILNY